MRIAFPALFALIASAAPLHAQSADDCYQATLRSNDREIIRVCTAALEKGGIQGETLSITLSNRGLGYLRNKEYDKSIIDFSEALLINPKNPYAFNSRGEAWREKGNNDRALADFADALNVDATFTAAYYNRGVTFERLGDNNAARAEYQKALAQTASREIDKWARRNAEERLAQIGGNTQQDRGPNINQRDRDTQNRQQQQQPQKQQQKRGPQGRGTEGSTNE